VGFVLDDEDFFLRRHRSGRSYHKNERGPKWAPSS
jgi:hypothetical protein